MVLRPILDVCNMETGYEGGGRRCDPWWRQPAARKQLSATLKDILAEARARRQESSRHKEGRGGEEVADFDSGIEGPWYAGTETGDA